jgi:hypothetical protein
MGRTPQQQRPARLPAGSHKVSYAKFVGMLPLQNAKRTPFGFCTVRNLRKRNSTELSQQGQEDEGIESFLKVKIESFLNGDRVFLS